jgi:hypothetical protein
VEQKGAEQSKRESDKNKNNTERKGKKKANIGVGSIEVDFAFVFVFDESVNAFHPVHFGIATEDKRSSLRNRNRNREEEEGQKRTRTKATAQATTTTATAATTATIARPRNECRKIMQSCNRWKDQPIISSKQKDFWFGLHRQALWKLNCCYCKRKK